MNPQRRFVVKVLAAGSMLFTAAGLILKPLYTLANRNNEAFSANTEADAIAAFFPGHEITKSNQIEIDTHDLVENGAVVPVKIRTTLPGVESITILAEKNPYPLIANFNLGPECAGFVATRIKMGKSGNVIAVIKSKGKLYSDRKFVEIMEGGCS